MVEALLIVEGNSQRHKMNSFLEMLPAVKQVSRNPEKSVHVCVCVRDSEVGHSAKTCSSISLLQLFYTNTFKHAYCSKVPPLSLKLYKAKRLEK